MKRRLRAASAAAGCKPAPYTKYNKASYQVLIRLLLLAGEDRRGARRARLRSEVKTQPEGRVVQG